MQQYSEFTQKKSRPLLGSRMIVNSKVGWHSDTLIIKHVSEKLCRLINSWDFLIEFKSQEYMFDHHSPHCTRQLILESNFRIEIRPIFTRFLYHLSNMKSVFHCNFYKIRKLFKNIQKRNTRLYMQLLGLLSYSFANVLC